MTWDVVGLGNALMDALVTIDDDSLLDELHLTRGIMHPVSHSRWQQVHDRLSHLEIVFDSGGSCANTIATLGRLGANVRYVGQVGTDHLGTIYGESLTDACGGHALHFTPHHASGKCLSIISRRDAERTMVTDLGASVHLHKSDAFVDLVVNARYAHFTGYTLLDGPIKAVALRGLQTATETGCKVSLDVADPFVVGLIRDDLWQAIEQHANILFLNEEEAKALTGHPPLEAIHEIATTGNVDTVVVKLGAAGSIILHQGDLTQVGIHRVEAIDTTGAGDAYAGGFLYGLSNQWPVETAARLGSMVAAWTVAQLGAVVKDSDLLARGIRETAP